MLHNQVIPSNESLVNDDIDDAPLKTLYGILPLEGLFHKKYTILAVSEISNADVTSSTEMKRRPISLKYSVATTDFTPPKSGFSRGNLNKIISYFRLLNIFYRTSPRVAMIVSTSCGVAFRHSEPLGEYVVCYAGDEAQQHTPRTWYGGKILDHIQRSLKGGISEAWESLGCPPFSSSLILLIYSNWFQ